ncbi:MAG: septation ring formation regulator EzrA [Pelagibacteraceae bacterium TMED170]|nr:MAG: septation ring formation regulator EzrA [Pelagibacteraceae bacterium TMED170]|tara:strand:+ start:45 stop:341 length:297 start_codon:yes stop_codon:yes gene_type:complete
MSLIKIFKTKKLFLFNIFLTLYIGINLLSGERGLISYFDKKNIEKELIQKASNLTEDLNFISNKNRLLSKNIDIDFLDSLYREKLKFGKKNEILIKLK